MSDPSIWNSDLVKIGIPGAIAIIATIVAYCKDVKLTESQLKHDRSMLILKSNLKSLDYIANVMNDYFEAWFEVLTAQGKMTVPEVSDAESIWLEIHTLWEKFDKLKSVRSNIVARLHVLDGKSALDILSTLRKLYESHWAALQSKTVMSHQDLQDLGHNIGGHRNDFYRSIRKIRKSFENIA